MNLIAGMSTSMKDKASDCVYSLTHVLAPKKVNKNVYFLAPSEVSQYSCTKLSVGSRLRPISQQTSR